MKKGIHPKYYDKAKIKCACGAEFLVGSTEPQISVEICSQCHPFFTGKEKLVDTAGRVDKFKARQEAAEKFRQNKRSENQIDKRNNVDKVEVREQKKSKKEDKDNKSKNK